MSEVEKLLKLLEEKLKEKLVSREDALETVVKLLGCDGAKNLEYEVENVHDNPEVKVVRGDTSIFICSEGKLFSIDERDPKLIKLGLYELGLMSKITQKQATKLIFDILDRVPNKADKDLPHIAIEVVHVNEREELAYQIANAILDKYIVKTFYRGDSVIGMFCYDNGVYQPCEQVIRAEIRRLAETSGEEISKKTTRWVVGEALARIKELTLTPLRQEPMAIAFKNKGFDWKNFLETGDLKLASFDFNPEIIIYHKIPHNLNTVMLKKLPGLIKFDPAGIADLETLANELCPKSLEVFQDWVGKKWPLLFEIIGYTLYPRYDFHKAIMLVGEGANGKSTYLTLVRTILGNENVVSISLQELVENDFMPAQLYRKLANIYPDLPTRPLRETGKFKVLTGEDEITANRKHRDPIKFVNYAKLLFSTNKLPRVSDMTKAFWRRWLVIEFPNKFEIIPSFFERTFTEQEIEGIIIVSLIAFRNVWLRRKFSFEETEADYREAWLRDSNNVYAFVKDLVETGKASLDPKNSELWTLAADLYNEYVTWCNEEEEKALAKKDFTQELERLFGVKRARKRILGKSEWVYIGIRLSD